MATQWLIWDVNWIAPCDNLVTVTSGLTWPNILTSLTDASVYSLSFFWSHVQQNQLRWGHCYFVTAWYTSEQYCLNFYVRIVKLLNYQLIELSKVSSGEWFLQLDWKINKTLWTNTYMRVGKTLLLLLDTLAVWKEFNIYLTNSKTQI